MKVLNYGASDARILLVGEGPGSEEDKTGIPFIGPAGQLLRERLQEAGIDPEKCFFANLCQHQPPGNKLERFFLSGGVPNEIVLEGLVALEQDIKRVRPNVIVALGAFPLWALTGKGRWVDEHKDDKHIRGYVGIQDYRGSILEGRGAAEGFKVVATYHPSYILREGAADGGTFNCDLDRVKAESAFPEVRWPEKEIIVAYKEPVRLLNYHDLLRGANPVWGPHPESRQDIRERLLATPDVPTTLDIEGIGSKLWCIGLANNRHSATVLPIESLGDMVYARSIVEETQSFNAQHAMFDGSILEWHHGMRIMPRVVFDTMLAQHAANIELPKGLDYLISIYTRQPYHKGMVNWTKIQKGQQPLDILYAYNGIDDWTQHEIMEEQIREELGDPRVNATFRFMMALLVPLWNMSKRGVRMDLEAIKNMNETLDSDAAAAGLELMIELGLDAPLNVKSGPHMQDLLYNRLGLPVIRETAKRGPATDDKTIATLVLKAKTPQQKKCMLLIRSIRKARDLKSKFFNVKFDDDGRMRGHYNPSKTVTGRLSSVKFYPTKKGTNAQNIPRDKRARRVFLADRGKVFCYADLEKAESNVVAQLTGDPRMLRDHSPGQNAHRNLGADLFGIAPEELDEDQYYLSKKTRHAGNYMQGWLTFMTTVNQDAEKTGVAIDAKQSKFFIQRYKDLHPALPRWWDATKRELYKTRTLVNLLGRVRTFHGHVGSILPEAVAYVPQSTVGDLLNVGLLNLEGISCPYTLDRGIWNLRYADINAELLDCGFESLMQIHDAVAFQVWEKDLDRALPLVRAAMLVPLTNPRTYEEFTIPVEINADIDPERLRLHKSNWGDAKTIKLGA